MPPLMAYKSRKAPKRSPTMPIKNIRGKDLMGLMLVNINGAKKVDMTAKIRAKQTHKRDVKPSKYWWPKNALLSKPFDADPPLP
jgi:hypothetical protein